LETNVNTFTVNKTGDISANTFVKSGGTSSQYLMADGSTTTAKYKVYSALLLGGTSATVEENTLGGSITITNPSTGIYQFTSSGLFTSGKTMIHFTLGNGGAFMSYTTSRIDANTIQISINDMSSGGGVGANIIDNSSLDIKVYN